jgi:putative SOS response-associated peptidase YedK
LSAVLMMPWPLKSRNDGLYEWQATAAKTKQPSHMRRPDDRPFAFAGLWERGEKSNTPDSREEVPGTPIITRLADGVRYPLDSQSPKPP